MRSMRLRRYGALGFFALLVAGCVTAPGPSAPPVVGSELASYQSPADAPRVLDAIDRRLSSGQWTVADLGNDELRTYSGLLLAAGRLTEAEQSLKLLGVRTPGDHGVLLTLTLIAGARGDAAAQAQRLAALEAAFPGDVEAAGIRARQQLASGDRAGAAQTWKKVVEKTENAAALTGLAQLALDAKNPQEALTWADRAVKAGPDDDRTWAARARAQIGLEHFLAARADLDQALALAPDDPWYLLDRGKLLWRHLYNPVQARADLELSVLKQPANVFGWATLGEVYEDQDLPRRAFDAWMKALSLKPDYRFAYPSAAMLAFRYRDFPRAAALARLAAKDYPHEYAFAFVEALSLRALGQADAAKTVLEQARSRFDRGTTVDELFRFLLTPGSDYYLNTAMKLETNDTIRLRLRFYQGCHYSLTGSANSARAAFQEVADSTLKKIPEIGAARDWLEHGP